MNTCFFIKKTVYTKLERCFHSLVWPAENDIRQQKFMFIIDKYIGKADKLYNISKSFGAESQYMLKDWSSNAIVMLDNGKLQTRMAINRVNFYYSAQAKYIMTDIFI